MRKVLKAVSILKDNGVIVHPTDTCYGLACSIFSKKALQKLYKVKKMPFSKPVSILVGSFKQALKYGKFNALAKKLAKLYWPGPLTIVVQRKNTLPKFLNPKTSTIGIRFLKHSLTLEIIRGLKNPIATTSANVSGEKEPYSAKEVKIKADFTIDKGKLPKIKPSTIVDVSEGKLKILRKGPVGVSLCS